MPPAGVRGQRMCVTLTSSLLVMPVHTRLVRHDNNKRLCTFKPALNTHQDTAPAEVTCCESCCDVWCTRSFTTCGAFGCTLTSEVTAASPSQRSYRRPWKVVQTMLVYPAQGNSRCLLSQRLDVSLHVHVHARWTWLVCVASSWGTGSAQR